MRPLKPQRQIAPYTYQHSNKRHDPEIAGKAAVSEAAY